MLLNDMFPNGKSYFSELVARRKLDKFLHTLSDEDQRNVHAVILPISVTSKATKEFASVTVTRYQVILILGHNSRIPALWAVDAGLCVTNV